MMLDLDRFKYVNDTMGHPAGDELLRQVAQRLQNIIGDRGEIGRLGGDEFQVILPDLDDRGKLGELADKVIQIVSQPYPIDGKRAIIGTSVGIAIAPYDGIEQGRAGPRLRPRALRRQERRARRSSGSIRPTSRTRRRSAGCCSTTCARRSRPTSCSCITSRWCGPRTTWWSGSRR